MLLYINTYYFIKILDLDGKYALFKKRSTKMRLLFIFWDISLKKKQTFWKLVAFLWKRKAPQKKVTRGEESPLDPPLLLFLVHIYLFGRAFGPNLTSFFVKKDQKTVIRGEESPLNPPLNRKRGVSGPLKGPLLPFTFTSFTMFAVRCSLFAFGSQRTAQSSVFNATLSCKTSKKLRFLRVIFDPVYGIFFKNGPVFTIS